VYVFILFAPFGVGVGWCLYDKEDTPTFFKSLQQLFKESLKIFSP